MFGTLMALMRLVHILAGIFWVGATLFLAGFLVPAIQAVGPSARPVMSQLMQQRRLQLWINISMSLAILAGLVLFAMDSKASGGGFGRSGMGIMLSIGALLAIAAAGVSGAMSKPASTKLGELAQRMDDAQRGGAAPSADLVAQAAPLQAKLARALNIMSWLLVLSAATMAIARYI
jgi:uncharacterized membrane protein